ncbi:MAG: sensor domain-containing diguanylate cyclase [Bacteroidetes bacterium]|nr:sensor domain-containing diguanylate cyclase [Bacteroidota bacterium]
MGIVTYSNKKDNSVYHNEDLELVSDIIKNIESQISFLTHTENKVLNDYNLKHQNQVLSALKCLSETLDIDELHTQIVALINRYLSSEYTAIYLYDKKNDIYACKALKHRGTEVACHSIHKDNYLLKYIKQRKTMIASSEIERWAGETQSLEWREAASLTKDVGAELVVPLTDMDSLLGFIVIGKPKGNDPYAENMLTMLMFIADRVQITLSNFLIKKTVEIDEMTGLYNRAFLKRRLKEEIKNALGLGTPLSLLMIDIDDFKWFNDNHGYDIGDIVIKAVVNAIKLVIRPTDEFCRFGGEEFPVIAIGANSEESDIVSSRILDSLRNNPEIKKLSDKYKRKISISIGTGSF